MKTSVSELGKNRYRLDVEVPFDRVRPFLDQIYDALAQEVQVKGFRPGKVPRRIIDQRLGKDFVRSEALKEALPELYTEALSESELDVVAPPEINVKTFEDEQDLAFEATVETRPTPELASSDGLQVARPPVDVTDEEVDEQIERLRVRFAELEVVSRPISEGDFALIDLKTYRHEETVDEATAKDLLVEVGAEMIVPALDSELMGKRNGDILKVSATLPERFGEKAGWQVGMQVLVKEVKARRLPELDDEFATTVSEFDTLDELRDDIRTKLRELKEEQAEGTVRERVIDAFVDEVVSVDLPEGMVELEIDALLEGLVRMLAARGIGIDRFMEAEDLDPQGLRSRFREQAVRNLKLRLGLDALAASEGLEATDEDREREVERIAERAGRDPEEVAEMLEDPSVASSVDGDIIRSKALDLLIERAAITTEEGSS